MSDSWTQRSYPFAEARRVAQEFARKEAPVVPVEGWGGYGPRETYTYGYALECLGSSMDDFRQAQQATGLDAPLFRAALPQGLSDLLRALRKLLGGELQASDKDEIALITKLGPDFLAESARHATEYFEQSDAPYFRIEAEFISDLRNELDKVSRQLTQDVEMFRGVRGA